MSNLDLSIVVCTRNRPDDLDRCLKSLSQLDYPYYDIIVIDNSDDQTNAALNRESCMNENAKYLHESTRGLSVARNRGIIKARGPIIAFTDDDCIPTNQWLRKALRNFNDPTVTCCTGRTLSFLSDPLSMRFEEYYGFDRGSIRRKFKRDDIGLDPLALLRVLPHVGKRRITSVAPAPFSVGLGNNMMFRRDVFDMIGYFDERLGAGTPARAGEETDMFYRILKAGKTIVYEPEAIVYHKHRQTYADLVNAVFACGLGVGAFLKKHIGFGDFQATLFYVGRLVNLLYATSSYGFKGERETAYLTSIELRGWINGFFKY